MVTEVVADIVIVTVVVQAEEVVLNMKKLIVISHLSWVVNIRYSYF